MGKRLKVSGSGVRDSLFGFQCSGFGVREAMCTMVRTSKVLRSYHPCGKVSGLRFARAVPLDTVLEFRATAVMRGGFQEGSYVRLVDVCIAQL